MANYQYKAVYKVLDQPGLWYIVYLRVFFLYMGECTFGIRVFPTNIELLG